MTKPSVPTRKAKGFGAAPKAGAAPATPSSRRPQQQQVPPALPATPAHAAFDEAMTEPRVPFIRRRSSNEPPAEAAKGDDDVMNQAQSLPPGVPHRTASS